MAVLTFDLFELETDDERTEPTIYKKMVSILILNDAKTTHQKNRQE